MRERVNMTVLQLFAVTLAGSILWSALAAAAPSAKLWPRWQTSIPGSTQIIDHAPWDVLLQAYLVTNHPSGINRFRYADVTKADRLALDKYLMQHIPPPISRNCWRSAPMNISTIPAARRWSKVNYRFPVSTSGSRQTLAAPKKW